MRAILIGNGYDLHYKLPTRYIDFLNTAIFLLDNEGKKYKTVGEIFGDCFFNNYATITLAYHQYQKIYDNAVVEHKKLLEIISLLKNNVWFKYFRDTFNKDVGWIDFEKEIRKVIDCFQCFFDYGKTNVNHADRQLSYDVCYVIGQFDLFENGTNICNGNYASLCSDYIIEYPPCSGKTLQNQEKIVEFLLSSHEQFSSALALYMKCFVDDIVYKIDPKELDENLFQAEKAITLNYTHTYEILNDKGNNPKELGNSCVFHIHGESTKEIVLGINPDGADTVAHADPIFAPFKKYFQRILYGTDTDYIQFIRDIDQNGQFNLSVVGHSLDITDKDIIEELFNKADTITIYYHSKKSMASIIKNIITIFGKEQFNAFRIEKDLQFIDMQDKDAIIGNCFIQEFDDIDIVV